MLLDKMGFYSRKPIFAQPGLSGSKYDNRKRETNGGMRLAAAEPQEAIEVCLTCTEPPDTCKGSDRCKRLRRAKA